MTHAGGRPTIYEPSFPGKLAAYLKTTGREQTALPTLEGFAIYLGVSMDAIAEWRKKYPELDGALKKITLFQKQQLVNDGIYGGKEINSTIVKLLLMNNHGMRERNDLTTDNKKLPTPIYSGKATDSIKR